MNPYRPSGAPLTGERTKNKPPKHYPGSVEPATTLPLETRLGGLGILYLTAQKMSVKVKEDILVTNISVIQ